MARTPAQRGKVGNWLVESRMARGWSTQEKARGEITRLTGWTIPQSVYAEWESGRRTPTEANLERLRAFYGDGPEGTVAPADLVAAVSVLIEALAAEREARLAWQRDFLDAMRMLATAAMQPAEPEPVTDGAPRR